MGRKGVSKRKPKQTKPASKAEIGGSSATGAGQVSAMQSLMRNNEATINRGGTNATAGSNGKNRKGK